MVVLSATVVRVAGQGLVVQDFPKTKASIRELTLPRFALDMLARRRMDAYSELLLPSATGGRGGRRTCATSGARRFHGSDVDWITPKSARGAVATLLRNEFDIDAAKDHSDTPTGV